ncbi:hypothetical protein TWF481_010989 [Arthrobotrys musiformis]|uniref:C2H2-type domain-containing protein n=1 Tax=Arthrobotrys musiformis TaxID=47236 RepID=A0AAV9VX04_9PEZI
MHYMPGISEYSAHAGQFGSARPSHVCKTSHLINEPLGHRSESHSYPHDNRILSHQPAYHLSGTTQGGLSTRHPVYEQQRLYQPEDVDNHLSSRTSTYQLRYAGQHVQHTTDIAPPIGPYSSPITPPRQCVNEQQPFGIPDRDTQGQAADVYCYPHGMAFPRDVGLEFFQGDSTNVEVDVHLGLPGAPAGMGPPFYGAAEQNLEIAPKHLAMTPSDCFELREPRKRNYGQDTHALPGQAVPLFCAVCQFPGCRSVMYSERKGKARDNLYQQHQKKRHRDWAKKTPFEERCRAYLYQPTYVFTEE